MITKSSFVVRFSEVDKQDVGIVGGKGANLGEMVRAKFPIPDGFIVTAQAYFSFLKANHLTQKINDLLSTVHFERPDSLMQVSSHIKRMIMQAEIPQPLTAEIVTSYNKLGGLFKDALVAVRSSAAAEDLPQASFAGQQETFLNVRGEANLILKVREGWASLFEPRAMFYRHEQKFDHLRVGMAMVVQKMVESDRSGIMFTLDPTTNDKSKLVIEAAPDHYEVSKSSLAHQVSSHEGKKQKLTKEQIEELAKLGKKLEHHYYFPQEIEWAIEKNKIYIVQTKAITTITNHKQLTPHQKNPSEKLPLLLKGTPASPGMAAGHIKIIHNAAEISKITQGDILVAPQTNPDYIPAMKKAAAIVTEKGGRTSHAAIVSRELGIPAIVETEKATQTLKTGMVVTVNGATGEVYQGASHLSQTETTLAHSKLKTATKIYIDLARPDLAEKISQQNADGIGLLHAESMIANIGEHPKKIIQEGKQKIYIEKLAEQIATLCRAFPSRPVVYRSSRYLHDPEIFNLELSAIKLVREKYELKNLWLMLPFVRTVKELIEVKAIITAAGLHRSPTFKLWLMVETPSNVILLDKFIAVGIDGVSIGSNELTKLMLGTDQDNSEIATEYEELNQAVLWAFEHTIKTAHKHHITSSIYGQAPSLYPALLEKLIHWGITNISISPDIIDKVRAHISEIEKKLISGKQ